MNTYEVKVLSSTGENPDMKANTVLTLEADNYVPNDSALTFYRTGQYRDVIVATVHPIPGMIVVLV